jgi:hypothetical protein
LPIGRAYGIFAAALNIMNAAVSGGVNGQ